LIGVLLHQNAGIKAIAFFTALVVKTGEWFSATNQENIKTQISGRLRQDIAVVVLGACGMKFGPGFLLTFIYYFSSSAILLSVVASKALDLGLGTGLPQQIGFVGGVVVGLIGASLNRTVSFEVPFESRSRFAGTLEHVLSQLGYREVEEVDGVTVYARPAMAKVLSGQLYVKLDDRSATIASRAVNIQKLKKQLLPEVPNS
jgi:hypothetical protein